MHIAKDLVPAGAAPTLELRRWLPQLSVSERDRRWAAVRAGMTGLDLDALVVLGTDIFWGMGNANMQYLFHIENSPACEGLLPLDGDPVVWSAAPQTSWPGHRAISAQGWVGDVRTRSGMKGIADELRARSLDGARIGLVGFGSAIQTTPVLLQGDVERLQELLPRADFIDAGQLLEEVRLVKSEEEIGMLRRAAEIARTSLAAMVESSRPGATEAEVYARMAEAQIRNGGEPSLFILLGSGPVEHPSAELWNLLHGAEGPKAPTTRPLAEGDVVMAEWHTKYGGYRAHTEFTVHVGKRAPAELLRIWDVAHECLEASRSALRAGNTLRDAWRELREPARRAGLSWVELGFHAMGTASPEFPTVVYEEGFGAPQLNGHGIGDVVLQEGMTFGNNIDLHDPSWKVDVGCMLADFMVVRPGAAEALVGLPRELPQVG